MSLPESSDSPSQQRDSERQLISLDSRGVLREDFLNQILDDEIGGFEVVLQVILHMRSYFE